MLTAPRLEILSPKSQVSGRRRIYFINTGKVIYADKHLQAGAGLAPDILPRACAWVRLTDKGSQQPFYFYNIHLDHLSPNLRNATTFHGYHRFFFRFKLDYTFVPSFIRVLDARIIQLCSKKCYPSDHFPLFTRIDVPVNFASGEQDALSNQ